MRNGWATSALALSLLAGACGNPAPPQETAAATKEAPAAAGPNVVEFRAHDYAFDGPESVPAGLTTVRLVNEGKEAHHITLARLDEGKTLKDALDAFAAGRPAPWAVDVGGPNAAMPGAAVEASLELQPGRYAMICFIPSADGKPHMMKGMVRELTVTEPTATARTLPPADIVLTLDDYTFTTDKPITAGRHIIRVENKAAQSHELIVVKLQPGKTAEDFARFAEKPAGGPPPGVLLDGAASMASGQMNQVTVDFEPGEYAFMCFVPDAKDGKPHFLHGMVKQFTVS